MAAGVAGGPTTGRNRRAARRSEEQISEPRRHHGRLRDGVEPVRRRSRLDPLALRGRLGSGFVRSIAAACYRGLR